MSIYCESCGHANNDGAQFCQGCGGQILATTRSGTLKEGTLLDQRYEIVKLIKAGGMGSVYKALDHRFDKATCAIKEMSCQPMDEQSHQYMVESFKKEAKILHELRHPNLPVVKDYFISHNHYFLVMDYVEGRDLFEIMKEYPKGVPEPLVTEWSIQILRALEHLHSQNPPIIYRDLKPGNVMLRTSDNTIVLIDFGIARKVNPGSDTTKTVIGTPAFSPIEIFQGRPEPRSDIYSLGGTMHCLLTGKVPSGPMEFEPIRTINPEVSENLETVVMKSLMMNMEDRYSGAREMREALERLSSSGISGETPLPSIESAHSSKSLPRMNISAEQKIKTGIETDGPKSTAGMELKKSTITMETLDKTVKTRTLPRKSLVASIVGIIIVLAGLGLGAIYKTFVIDNAFKPPEMIPLEGGHFKMGSGNDLVSLDDKDHDEKPLHSVEVSPFYLGKYEVTNPEYCDFLNSEGNHTEGGSSWIVLFGDVWNGIVRDDAGRFKVKDGFGNKPVTYVSWYGAVAYCNWLSRRQRLTSCYGPINDRGSNPSQWRQKNGYRLPTEAEWEYACRAGSDTIFFWGNEPDVEYCWFNVNSERRLHEVGMRKPNSFGLFDMSGNLYEWCNDIYQESYYSVIAEETVIDPTGPSISIGRENRVRRGGCSISNANKIRSANRSKWHPQESSCENGFRVARSKNT